MSHDRGRFNVDGVTLEREVDGAATLFDVLAGTGVLSLCGDGLCGACTIILDGNAVCACLVLAGSVGTKPIETAVGSARSDRHGLFAALRRGLSAISEECRAGIALSATVLLDRNPRPTRDEIERMLAGHACAGMGDLGVLCEVILAAVLNADRSRRVSDKYF